MEIPAENDSKKLLFSLLLDSRIESDKRTPAYMQAIGHHTAKAELKCIRWQFCNEISRVTSEMQLVISLFSKIHGDEYFKSLGTTKTKYYVFLVGSFFNLVHQVKDKLFRLLYSMNYENYERYDREARKIDSPKINKVRKLKWVKIFDIDKELSEWEQEAGSGIGVALRHRTKHHHNVSRIPLSEDLQKVDFMWMVSDTELQKVLSDYGKRKIKDVGQEAFDRWHTDNLKKLTNTIEEVMSSLNAISKKIFNSSIDIPRSMSVVIKEFPELFEPV